MHASSGSKAAFEMIAACNPRQLTGMIEPIRATNAKRIDDDKAADRPAQDSFPMASGIGCYAEGSHAGNDGRRPTQSSGALPLAAGSFVGRRPLEASSMLRPARGEKAEPIYGSLAANMSRPRRASHNRKAMGRRRADAQGHAHKSPFTCFSFKNLRCAF